MDLHQTQNLTIIGGSFAVALALAVFPLPDSWAWFRPQFVVLLVIYWIMALPHRVGIGMAWLAGLAQDIVEQGILGQHALGMVAVAYVCALSYQRIRNYALWQQCAWIFILVGIHQLFWNWVQSLQGYNSESLIFLLPALMSAIMWPFVLVLMEWLRVRALRGRSSF